MPNPKRLPFGMLATIAASMAANPPRQAQPFLVDATEPPERFEFPKTLSDEEASRRLVKLNPHHPHHALTRTVDAPVKEYRQLSAARLEEVCNQHFAVMQHNEPEVYAATPWPETRAAKIEVMRDHLKRHFKSLWKKNYGWEFDECYTPAKFFSHLKAMRDSGYKPGLEGAQLFHPKPEDHAR